MRFSRAVESGHRSRRHERADRAAMDGGGTKVFQQVWHRRGTLFSFARRDALGRHERVEASIDIQIGRFDDWPNTTERLIGNVMPFYLEFQSARSQPSMQRKSARRATNILRANGRARDVRMEHLWN